MLITIKCADKNICTKRSCVGCRKSLTVDIDKNGGMKKVSPLLALRLREKSRRYER